LSWEKQIRFLSRFSLASLSRFFIASSLVFNWLSGKFLSSLAKFVFGKRGFSFHFFKFGFQLALGLFLSALAVLFLCQRVFAAVSNSRVIDAALGYLTSALFHFIRRRRGRLI